MSFEREPGSSCKCRLVGAEELQLRFRELEEAIRPAFKCARGELTPQDALVMAMEQKAWVFLGEDNGQILCTLIAEFCQFPQKRVLNILAYAGKAREFYWFLPVIENWAKWNGATAVRGYGQEPQMRLARRHGMKEIYRVYEKEL